MPYKILIGSTFYIEVTKTKLTKPIFTIALENQLAKKSLDTFIQLVYDYLGNIRCLIFFLLISFTVFSVSINKEVKVEHEELGAILHASVR